MILTALCELYDRLLADPGSGVPRPGYSDGSASVALEISREGRLVRAVPLGTQKGKKVVGLRLKVPERVKRSSGDAPNFLCDGPEYLLGVRPGAGQADERAKRRKALAKTLHEEILGEVDDDGARAVLAFLSGPTEDLLSDARLRDVSDALNGGGNIVFRLEGDAGFVHDRPAVKRAWEAHKEAADPNAPVGQCLVTGEYGPITRLHKSTSGVAGAQSTGASLVSFNFPAAESYGKSQGQNSPVSERAAFAYGTALNWLTAHERHHVLAGDTTILFWAERSGPEEDLMLDLFADAFSMDVREIQEDPRAGAIASSDETVAVRLKGIVEAVFRGRLPAEGITDMDEGIQFYVLGLAPNAARVSVRFWNVGTFGDTLENVRRHYEDMAVVHRENERPLNVGRLLLEMAPAASRKRDAVPGVLVGSLMRSILEGTAYPQSLYSTLIFRIRVDSNGPDQPKLERKVNYARAAYIKAHLKRNARIAGDKAREEELTEMLNTENRNPGYLLGRLFALLEKAQQDANPKINATIKDRYYASASATPGSVFPVLMKLAQHHISKSEYGGYVDRLIQDVMDGIDSFPAYLNLEQQGLFALGYYQQKSALYKTAG